MTLNTSQIKQDPSLIGCRCQIHLKKNRKMLMGKSAENSIIKKLVRMRTLAYRAAYKIITMKNLGTWPEKANRQEIDEFVEEFTKEHEYCYQAIQALYEKYGFNHTGIRNRYYADNGENAYIMTTDTITSPAFQSHFNTLKQTYEQKWGELSLDNRTTGGTHE